MHAGTEVRVGDVKADVEIAIDRSERTERARLNEALEAVKVAVEAAVLHHGVHFARRFRKRHHLASVFERVCHRLLAEYVAAVPQGRLSHWQVALRYRAVEDHVRTGLVEHALQIRADYHLLQAELLRSLPRGLFPDVDQAHHLK